MVPSSQRRKSHRSCFQRCATKPIHPHVPTPSSPLSLNQRIKEVPFYLPNLCSRLNFLFSPWRADSRNHPLYFLSTTPRPLSSLKKKRKKGKIKCPSLKICLKALLILTLSCYTHPTHTAPTTVPLVALSEHFAVLSHSTSQQVVEHRDLTETRSPWLL